MPKSAASGSYAPSVTAASSSCRLKSAATVDFIALSTGCMSMMMKVTATFDRRTRLHIEHLQEREQDAQFSKPQLYNTCDSPAMSSLLFLHRLHNIGGFSQLSSAGRRHAPRRPSMQSRTDPNRARRGHIKQIASPWHGVRLHGVRMTPYHLSMLQAKERRNVGQQAQS